MPANPVNEVKCVTDLPQTPPATKPSSTPPVPPAPIPKTISHVMRNSDVPSNIAATIRSMTPTHRGRRVRQSTASASAQTRHGSSCFGTAFMVLGLPTLCTLHPSVRRTRGSRAVLCWHLISSCSSVVTRRPCMSGETQSSLPRNTD